ATPTGRGGKSDCIEWPIAAKTTRSGGRPTGDASAGFRRHAAGAGQTRLWVANRGGLPWRGRSCRGWAGRDEVPGDLGDGDLQAVRGDDEDCAGDAGVRQVCGGQRERLLAQAGRQLLVFRRLPAGRHGVVAGGSTRAVTPTGSAAERSEDRVGESGAAQRL